jgi:threonylcarbamoyladenosine tRNA methylthiotransferase MtaB
MAADAFRAIDPAARVIDGRVDGALAAALPTISGVELVGEVPSERPTRTRAFVKVQDGCSFYCTYCVIPQSRGPERSLAPGTVVDSVRRALADGHREVVLTGINIGTYDGGASERGPRGSHRWEALSLAGLIRRILDETPVERLRLSSMEPQHVTEELLRVWTDRPDRCLPHFHLPLQSGDDGVLRRMGRRYDAAFYAALVRRVRAAIPGAAVHADVIVGFPTEDDDAWRRSRDFIAAQEFAGLHVFRYSQRPGTAALRMAGHVPEVVRRRRAAELLAHAAERRRAMAAAQAGRTLRVLFEQRLEDGRWLGHAENHVLVATAAPGAASLENVIADVAITGVDADAERCTGVLNGGAHAQ